MKKQKAFTLIELLITVGIIVILVAIALLSYANAVVRTRVTKAQSDMRILAGALESYYVDINCYVIAADSVEVGGGFMNGSGPTAWFAFIVFAKNNFLYAISRKRYRFA